MDSKKEMTREELINEIEILEESNDEIGKLCDAVKIDLQLMTTDARKLEVQLSHMSHRCDSYKEDFSAICDVARDTLESLEVLHMELMQQGQYTSGMIIYGVRAALMEQYDKAVRGTIPF